MLPLKFRGIALQERISLAETELEQKRTLSQSTVRRNEAVAALRNGTMREWKAESGYHYRSISETAMSRYKGLTSGKLSFRCCHTQVGEIMATVNAINKVIGLGMPVRN